MTPLVARGSLDCRSKLLLGKHWRSECCITRDLNRLSPSRHVCRRATGFCHDFIFFFKKSCALYINTKSGPFVVYFQFSGKAESPLVSVSCPRCESDTSAHFSFSQKHGKKNVSLSSYIIPSHHGASVLLRR